MDQSLFHLINEEWTSPALDLFMAALSNGAIWKPLFIAIALAAFFFGGFRGRAFIVCLLLALAVTEPVTATLKAAFDRHRPKQVESVRMVQLQRMRPAFLTLFKTPVIRFSDQSDRNRAGPSFPSGHVVTNTIIATYCMLFYRRRGWLYWFVAAAVGYSRIYLGAHWPRLFLGVGEALLLLSLFELIWRIVARKWMPRVFARHPTLIALGGRPRPRDALHGV
ncbi:MAG: hypothetical protein DME67_00490 [Verrucomicrobia bacterium]|nr:MAG: hypothetical protein DME67_00490 [Verrucomicrobiota bacterium]